MLLSVPPLVAKPLVTTSNWKEGPGAPPTTVPGAIGLLPPAVTS